jgi:hypothetical protein
LSDQQPPRFKGTYTKTEHFEIVDVIGVPHQYCITPKHVAVAADEFGGMLGVEAIRTAESKHGARCGMRGCRLPYDEHEQALLVGCTAELEIGGTTNPELHAMLLANKEEATKNGYAGFAFVKQ